MAGPWDAMGQGVQAGVNAWLERQRQQSDQGLLELRRQELGLNQANSAREADLVAQAQAQAEQEKRAAGYKKLSDYSDPSKGIFVYEYDELSPGAYVPVPRDEQLRRYQAQKEQWDQSEAQRSQTEFNRDYAIAKLRGGEGSAQKPPDDTPALLQQLYDKQGRMNTAVATSLFTRMLQAQLPPGLPINPVEMLRGPEGVRRARDIATYLGTAAGSYHPGRPVGEDLLQFLSGMSPDLQAFLNPPPPKPQVPPPTTGMTFPSTSTASPPAVGGAATVRELLPQGTPAVTEQSSAGKPMRVTDSNGRNWYWDAAQGMWLQE